MHFYLIEPRIFFRAGKDCSHLKVFWNPKMLPPSVLCWLFPLRNISFGHIFADFWFLIHTPSNGLVHAVTSMYFFFAGCLFENISRGVAPRAKPSNLLASKAFHSDGGGGFGKSQTSWTHSLPVPCKIISGEFKEDEARTSWRHNLCLGLYLSIFPPHPTLAPNLGEALRRIAEGASMIRMKGKAGTGNIVEAVTHTREIFKEIRRLKTLDEDEVWRRMAMFSCTTVAPETNLFIICIWYVRKALVVPSGTGGGEEVEGYITCCEKMVKNEKNQNPHF